MKHTYIQPQTNVIKLDATEMLAASCIKIDNTKKVDASNSFSSEKIWGENDWNDTEN